MDHEAMRAAYHRALNIDKTDFTDVCNLCKLENNDTNGEIVDVVTSDAVYKIWYCSECLAREAE